MSLILFYFTDGTQGPEDFAKTLAGTIDSMTANLDGLQVRARICLLKFARIGTVSSHSLKIYENCLFFSNFVLKGEYF